VNQPKLTINESAAQTPTAQVIAKAAQEANVTDSKGRVITLRKPGILAQYRIIEVMGQSADIATYRGMVTPLIWISAIDGDHVPPLASKLQLEGLIQRIGDEGLEAVVSGIVKHFGQQDAEADKAAIKK
jgi:hypothetical protein